MGDGRKKNNQIESAALQQCLFSIFPKDLSGLFRYHKHCHLLYGYCKISPHTSNGPRQANLVLIAYASSEGSGEPAHPRSLARTFAARSYKQ